jgi:hypothetical protein
VRIRIVWISPAKFFAIPCSLRFCILRGCPKI